MFKENRTAPTLLIGSPSPPPTPQKYLTEINKPGRCPVIIPNSHLLCGKRCSSDASCSGTQRCCPTSCGQQCQRPEGGKSGSWTGRDDGGQEWRGVPSKPDTKESRAVPELCGSWPSQCSEGSQSNAMGQVARANLLQANSM